MGATLSTRAEWSAATSGSSGAKLEFGQRNESLLRDLNDYVTTLVTEHSREARVVFKRPFEWRSKLRTNDFESIKASESYTASDTSIVSTATTALGEPLLKVSHVGSGSDIRAWTFNELYAVLRCAGDRAINEVQASLESNRDPMANIMGPGYGGDGGGGGEATLLETHERLVRERARDGVDSASVEDLDNTFRLLLLLGSLDVKLLQTSVKEIGRSVRLNAEAVENEVNLLKEFTGQDEQSCLRVIEFTSSYRFDNGCRAPPWRQVHGDIAYLHVKPVDTDPRYVTANTTGFYTNKGLKLDGEIDYEKTSEIYSSLVALLKTTSHHFAQNIMNQEYRYKGGEDQTDGGRLGASDKPSTTVDREKGAERVAPKEKKGGGPARAGDSQVKGKKVATGGKWKGVGDGSGGGKKGSPARSQEFVLGPRSREPTQKWKNLTTVAEMPAKSKPPQQPPKSSYDKKTRAGSTQPTKKSRGSRIAESFSRSRMDDMYVSESSTDDDEEEEVAERRQETSDLPAEYWQIQKLVRYLKGGNQTATVIALCSMRDFDLTQETCQMAIRDVGGLEVLINLLETSDVRCQIGSLKILRDVSRNSSIRTSIADLEGLETMVKMLQVPNKELMCLAAETIANVAKFRRARRTVRQYGGIKKLVALLQQPVIDTPETPEEELNVAVARSGASALWSCSKSTRNKQSIHKAGAVPLLAKLLKCNNESVLVPVVGTLQECASEFIYRQMIRTEGMVEDLVKNLSSSSEELQMHCASAIFKCAEDEETRELVRKFDGLGPLARLLKKSTNKDLLAAATGAIWKCAVSVENVQQFQKLDTVDSLVTLLHDQPEEVLINVVGALGECAKVNANRTVIRKKQGIAPLVSLLTGTNHALLINVTKAVGACAHDLDCMTIIDQNDGVRLLWSLLKSPNPAVQSSAAWAICPCIENAKDAGEMVRSFVGGLELIVGLLKSDDKEVLASVCAAIANIAKDEENLAVITDHGVVALLAKLTTTSQGHLRKHLAEAIARCCMWGNNRVAFGVNGAVAPLVGYLASSLPDVHCATAKALYQLSKDPNNCITMHDSGVVKPLLKMIGARDEELQEASAGCISNIRRLALANERARYG